MSMVVAHGNQAKQRRYPVAPVVEVLADRMGDGLNATTGARVLGIDVRDWHRYSSNGHVAWFTADRLACALGLHPSALWPSWFDDGLVDCDEKRLRQVEYDRRARAKRRAAA